MLRSTRFSHVLICAMCALLPLGLLGASCGSSAGDDTGGGSGDSSQLKGTWTGMLTITGLSKDGETWAAVLTCDSAGKVTRFDGGPAFTSLSGALSVDAEGQVSGTLNTTHNTDYGVETVTWHWTGRMTGSAQMNVSIVYQWSNTSGSEGSALLAGTFRRQ